MIKPVSPIHSILAREHDLSTPLDRGDAGRPCLYGQADAFRDVQP